MRLSAACRVHPDQSDDLRRLRSGGKTQVMIECAQKADGYVELREIHTVIINVQHAEPLKNARSKGVAGDAPDLRRPPERGS